MTSDDIIRLLKLQPHPVEGGYYLETYRDPLLLPGGVSPNYAGPRNIGTAIYYLLKPGHVSELHVLPGIEVFHFYLGDPVRMLQLHPDGQSMEVLLGSDILAGHVPQCVVPAGVWQGTSLIPGGRFALLGATMSPGFEFEDYRGATRSELLAHWPLHAERIRELTPRG
jgi:uncharacterized protein